MTGVQTCALPIYYEKATYYFLESARLKAELADSTGLAATYNNLGLVYTNWENPKMAMKYFRMAVSINTLRKNIKALAVNYNGLGDLYLSLRQADSALYYYQKSLELKTATGQKQGIVIAMQGIGKVYEFMKNDPTAAEWYRKALTLATETGSGHEIATLNQSLGEISYRQNDLGQARQMLTIALNYAVKENILDLIRQSCEDLTEISIKTGDKNGALDFFSRYRVADDSLYSSSRTKAVAEMQTKYEAEKTERENMVLMQQSKVQQAQIRFLILITMVLLFLGLTIMYLFRQKNRAYRQIVKKNLEIVEAEKQMKERKKVLADDSSDLPNNMPIQDIANTTLGLLVKLTRLMEEEWPYLEPGITIEDLCRKLNTNRTYLSQLINENFNRNFNSYINEFRIREARRLLVEPKHDHLSVEGIGSMSGFTSKVTFHSTFKQMVGVTPSYFRKSVARILTQ